MSLSSQYLEELSKRYKKQVEEMQRLFDKTLATLTEESKKRDERNKELEERLNTLTLLVENLIAEKNSWRSFTQWVLFISIITFCIFTFCKRGSRNKQPLDTRQENAEIQRRKSVDVITHNNTTKKKRRPSDQALKIVRSAMLASDDDTDKRQSKEKKKKKKKYGMKRSNSANTLNEESISSPEIRFQPSVSSQVWHKQPPPSAANNWVEGVRVEELPIVLDESEHSTLEELPLEMNVDAPVYIKTALDFRLGRVSSHNGPIQINGNSKRPTVTRKSVSLDETNRRRSPVPSVNGGASTSSADESRTPKKEKKGFKKLFKRVF